MAHFVRVKDSVVQEAIVINNDVIGNAEGLEGEAIGIAFCKSLFGEDTEWLQTSYSATFRGKYAAVGDYYDSNKDEFVSTK